MDDRPYLTGQYWENKPDFYCGDSEWKAKHLFELVMSVPSENLPTRSATVCEVGCGAGGVLNSFVSKLQREGLDSTGVGFDISQAALDRARSLFSDLEFERGSAFEIDRSFDIVLVVDVLEHLESPVEFLHRCLSLARVTIIHLPLDENLWGRLLHGKSYHDYLREDRGHVGYFSKRTGFQLIHRSGGQIVTWKYTPWGLEHDFDDSRSGRFAKALRAFSFPIHQDLSVRVFGGASLALVCRASQVGAPTASPKTT